MAWNGCPQFRRSQSRPLHHDLTDLNHRLNIGIVRNISHDLTVVRAKRTLKGFHGIKQKMAHRQKRGGRSWRRSLVLRPTAAAPAECAAGGSSPYRILLAARLDKTR